MQVFLETDRVILRRFTEEDVDNLVDLNSDPEVMRFLTGGEPIPRDVIQNETLPGMLDDYRRFHGYGYWAAIERSSGEFLGWFGLRPGEDADPGEAALGYRLRRSAWGKGYATEVSCALIRKAFTELGVERVVATTDKVNHASRRVMEKAGMTLVRIFRFDDPWPHLPPGPEQDGVDYALSKDDWERLIATGPTDGG